MSFVKAVSGNNSYFLVWCRDHQTLLCLVILNTATVYYLTSAIHQIHHCVFSYSFNFFHKLSLWSYKNLHSAHDSSGCFLTTLSALTCARIHTYIHTAHAWLVWLLYISFLWDHWSQIACMLIDSKALWKEQVWKDFQTSVQGILFLMWCEYPVVHYPIKHEQR